MAPTLVVAHRAMYFAFKPETRAGDDGAGYLSAGTQNLLLEGAFAGIGRKARHNQKRVGGVQADAHHVEFACPFHVLSIMDTRVWLDLRSSVAAPPGGPPNRLPSAR